MKIWVVSQYYKPEIGPVQSRIYGFANIWQKDGHDVTIFTTTPHHYPLEENKSNKLKKAPNIFKEKFNGINTIRHKTKKIKNRRFASNLRSQISFSLKLSKHLFSKEFTKESPNVVIATSPSLLCCLVGYFLAKKHNAKFIFEVRNLVPDTHISSRIIKHDGFYAKILNFISDFLYEKADAVTVLSLSMAKTLYYRGVKKDKIFLIYDGIPDTFLDNADRSKHSLKATSIRNSLQIHPMTKIVMFTGVFSKKQGLGQIIEAAKILMSRNDIIFIMAGEGEDKTRLMNMAKGMPNVKFLSSVKSEDALGYYACADLLIVPHRDSTDINLHIPMTLFEVLATKTPSIACVSGEARKLIETSNSGYTVDPENPQQLSDKIIKAFENYESAKLKANNGPAFVASKFRLSSLARQYIAVANKISK